jgi:hypothetical protein
MVTSKMVTSKITSKTVTSKIKPQNRSCCWEPKLGTLTVIELTKIPQYWPQDNLYFTSHALKFVKLEKCRRLDKV